VQITLVVSLFFTLVVVALSLGGLVLVRRWILAEDLKTQHDVTDPLSQVVGMMFAVLLGFMVGDAMQRFAQARSIVQQEAASLGDVFRLADGCPTVNRDRIRALCVTYAEQTINDEWPKLAAHKTSTVAWQTYRKLWAECVHLVPEGQGESNVHQTLLNCMVTLADNHRLRVEALHNGLPAVLWVVLVIGGVATIVFTYFFAANRLKIQLIMVSMVSLVICLNIFLLASYDDPFSGDVMVAPTAFETDLQTFRMEIDASAPKDVH
jgi:hypothetical protein